MCHVHACVLSLSGASRKSGGFCPYLGNFPFLAPKSCCQKWQCFSDSLSVSCTAVGIPKLSYSSYGTFLILLISCRFSYSSYGAFLILLILLMALFWFFLSAVDFLILLMALFWFSLFFLWRFSDSSYGAFLILLILLMALFWFSLFFLWHFSDSSYQL